MNRISGSGDPSQAPDPYSSPSKITRRALLGLAGGAIAGLGLYAGEISRHELDFVPVGMRLAGLPDAFDGFKIVQISDFHFEEFTEPFFIKRVVSQVNSLGADLVVLTGDFVSFGPLPRHFAARWAYRCAEILQGIDCPMRYAVLGNHDALVNPIAVTDALELHRIPVLINRHVPIERGGSRIWLAGVADVSNQTPRLSEAVPKPSIRDGAPVILLAHEPDYANAVVGHDVALVLSGHTHGGQVRLPFIPPFYLPRLGRQYVEGHFIFEDGMQLYVNRGIGAVGVPFRFRCPPEITLITLTPQRRA